MKVCVCEYIYVVCLFVYVCVFLCGCEYIYMCVFVCVYLCVCGMTLLSVL